MKLSLASFDQIWENKTQNRSFCKKLIKEATSKDADMIIFPEMTLTGFSMNVLKNAESIKNSLSLQFFLDQAKTHNIAIVFGICINESDKFSNAAIFADNNGNIGGLYKKIHPFSFAGEEKHFASGDKIGGLTFKNARIGLSICYDLRFPELYRLYAGQTDIMITIANWPEKRIDHWCTLLKARAIENQFFMAGVNRIGSDPNGNTYIQSSRLFSPEGKECIPIFTNAYLSIYDINPTDATNWQNQFPALKDRRIYNILPNA